MEKNWKGNKKTTFVTLGASSHTEHKREENDFYATQPKAVNLLCEVENFKGTIWENACGKGHISKRLKKLGYAVISTDLIDRGYGEGGVDFLECFELYGDNIVTNPPYRYAKQWVEHSMELLEDGSKLALLLKIQFLESASRRDLFRKYPPKKVYCCSERIICGMNGNFYQRDNEGNYILDSKGKKKKLSSAACYAWFVWEKGYTGETTLDWIN